MTTENFLSFAKEATKAQAKLRLAIGGPSGSGKTYSMLSILMAMGCQKIVVLDTEYGSAAKYSNEFGRKFDTIDNTCWKGNFDPRRLSACLKSISGNYDGIIVDSLTHFWMGPGGMLTLVDEFAKKAAARNGKFDTYAAWKQADPLYNELIQTVLGLPCHFAAGLRAKTEYVRSEDSNGKTKITKTGMGLQIREGFEYEFDVEGMLDMDHNFVVGKTRCSTIDGKIYSRPAANIADPLVAWLTDGTPVVPATTTEPTTPAPAPTPDPAPAPITVAIDFVAKMQATKTIDELKAVANEIRVAHRAKQITQEAYNNVLSPAYKAQLKAVSV